MTEIDYSGDRLETSVSGTLSAARDEVQSKASNFRRRLIVTVSLVGGDVVSAFAAWQSAHVLVHVAMVGSESMPAFGLLIAIVPMIFCAFGLYGARGPGPIERLRQRATGAFSFTVIAALVLMGDVSLVYGLLISCLAGLLLLILGHYCEEVVRLLLIRTQLWGAPTAVVGISEESTRLVEFLLQHPEAGLRPIYFVSESGDMSRPERGVLLGGPEGEQYQDWSREEIEVLLFASTKQYSKSIAAWIAFPPSCAVVVCHSMQDLQSLWLKTRDLGGSVGFEIRRDLYLPRFLWLKRCVDLLLAVPLAVIVLPVLGMLTLAVKIVDPGPALFRQDRIGLNGNRLRVFKLRTMYTDAETRLSSHLAQDQEAHREWHNHYKLSVDPRVLPIIGNFLRRTSIDELPQLLNVIRGEMSLIGPRPFPPYHMAAFDEEFQALRASVPPGLTGLWQVSGRSDSDLKKQERQDSYYIRNWSVWLDLYILLQTVTAVALGKGAR